MKSIFIIFGFVLTMFVFPLFSENAAARVVNAEQPISILLAEKCTALGKPRLIYPREERGGIMAALEKASAGGLGISPESFAGWIIGPALQLNANIVQPLNVQFVDVSGQGTYRINWIVIRFWKCPEGLDIPEAHVEHFKR